MMQIMDRTQRARWLWACGIGYVLLLVAIVWALLAARNWALTELATPKSVRQWQAWREDVEQQQSQRVPVRRSVPKSVEPPALVLMRDYFVVSLVGAVLFTSLLYWVIAWFITGIVSGTRPADS